MPVRRSVVREDHAVGEGPGGGDDQIALAEDPRICGALGGRLDMTVASLQLLAGLSRSGAEGYLLAADGTVLYEELSDQAAEVQAAGA